MIFTEKIARIINKIDNLLRQNINYYNESRMRLVLTVDVFTNLFIVLNRYDFHNINSDIDDSKFFIDINKCIAIAKGVYVNWNRDTKRLLIRDCYYKIVFFPEKESHVSSLYKKIKFIKLDNIGIDVSCVKNIYSKKTDNIFKKIGLINKRKLIVGFYGQLYLPSDETIKEVKKLIHKVLDSYKKEAILVLSSGSGMGVGGLANSLAKEKNIATIGIIPEPMKDIINPHDFSYLISEGTDWGDQSSLFGEIPDAIIFLGGGFWSYLEYTEAKKRNKPIFFYKFKGSFYCEIFKKTVKQKAFSSNSIEKLIKEIKSIQIN